MIMKGPYLCEDDLLNSLVNGRRDVKILLLNNVVNVTLLWIVS